MLQREASLLCLEKLKTADTTVSTDKVPLLKFNDLDETISSSDTLPVPHIQGRRSPQILDWECLRALYKRLYNDYSCIRSRIGRHIKIFYEDQEKCICNEI